MHPFWNHRRASSEVVGVDTEQGGDVPQDIGTRHEGNAVGGPSKPLDEAGTEPPVALGVRVAKQLAIASADRSQLVQRAVGVRGCRENDRHSELDRDAGRSERADVGHAQVDNVKRALGT